MLAAGFGELAVQLGAGDGGNPVASVHGVLAASLAPWLLIFDNLQAIITPLKSKDFDFAVHFVNYR